MTIFQIPVGEETALIGNDIRLSFDQLHNLRNTYKSNLQEYVADSSVRIMGMLSDDLFSLVSLIAVPEICDFMPMNPALAPAEIERFVKGSGATIALVAKPHLDKFGLLNLPEIQSVIVVEDLIDFSVNSLEWSEVPAFSFGPGRLILHTSGSTGQPKRVPIEVDAINASAKNIAKSHQLVAEDLGLNALPTFHIGALVDVLLAPLSVGGSVAITDKRDASGLAEALKKFKPTWVQIVPTILRRMVEDLSAKELLEASSSLKFVRSVSAPVPPTLQDKAENLMRCQIVEMYGMTETAGQICTNGRDAVDRSASSVGKPDGVPVVILDRHGSPVPEGMQGEICVSGPTVFNGYEGVDRDEVFFDDWFRTGDAGFIDVNGFLHLSGRIKEMINSGGEKISPAEVEAVALQMEQVVEAAAYALPHPTLVETVGLTVAVRDEVDEEKILSHLQANLATFKCPRKIHFVEQLPRLPNSKVDRLGLKNAAQERQKSKDERAESQATGSEFKNAQEEQIAKLWAEAIGSREPNREDDFFDMGGDSLSAITFLTRLEAIVPEKISSNQLFETPKFEDLVQALLDISDGDESTIVHRAEAYIRTKMAGWQASPALKNGLLRSIGGLKKGQPLFWSAQSWGEIVQAVEVLGARRPIYAAISLFQMQDRTEDDWQHFGKMLADEIDQIQPEGTIFLGGFCGGAQAMHYALIELLNRGREIGLFLSLDYWPKDVVNVPTIHGFSKSALHSATELYTDPHLALDVLYPNGYACFKVRSDHIWAPEFWVHMAQDIELALDPKTRKEIINQPNLDANAWSLAQRQAEPKYKLAGDFMPLIFGSRDQLNIKVKLRNTGAEPLLRSSLSGLAVEAHLCDQYWVGKQKILGAVMLENDIEPGETETLEIVAELPKRKKPRFFALSLSNQGVCDYPRGRQKAILWNLPFKVKLPN